jgi:hypothetical protein
MNKRYRYIGILTFVLLLALATLACGLGGDTEPTQAPPPIEEATQPPAAATEAPVEAAPTEAAPAEPPTEAPAEPQPTEPPTEEPAPLPPENVIAVDAVRGYRDHYGSLHIVGLVTNYTDRAVDSVEVEIEIFDANNNSLFTDVTYIGLSTLMPGETSPFAYWVSDDFPDADHYTAAIVGHSVSETERATPKIDGAMLTIDDTGDLHVTGLLVNNTDTPIEIRNISVATFDADENLFTAETIQAALVRHLDPGEDGPFRVAMTGPEDGTANISNYQIYIDAETAEPAEPYDLVISENNYYYMDAYDNFHLVGEITNNSDLYLSVSLVAGIYDVDGNTLDAASTDLPTFSLGPGETMPYDFSYWGPLNYKSGLIDEAASYTVQWDPYWTWESFSLHAELATQNNTNEVSSNRATFNGEILNNSGEEVASATVIVNLYDIETGELVATGYGGVYDALPANGVADYTVWIDIPADFDFDNVNYTITVYGELP